jgi:hypothetical protein
MQVADLTAGDTNKTKDVDGSDGQRFHSPVVSPSVFHCKQQFSNHKENRA